MQAVILAAGEGKRMLPLTLERPKPLVTVLGKPLIEYTLDVLPDEVDEVIMVVGYKAPMIMAHLGDTYNGKTIRYVHQWMAAGTAHALSLARPFLSGKFLLLYADDILGADAIREAITHPLALLAAPHEDPRKFGVITLNEDGSLAEIVEKPEVPASNFVSTGATVLDERLFAYPAVRHESGEYYMTSPLALLAQDHPVAVIEQPVWIPVGSPEDVLAAETRLLQLTVPSN